MIYIVAEHYQQVKDYIIEHDLNSAEVRFVNSPIVLKATSKPTVVVLGDGAYASDGIVEQLARREAVVTYSEPPAARFRAP